MKFETIPDELEHVIIILDNAAKSFCYYNNNNEIEE